MCIAFIDSTLAAVCTVWLRYRNCLNYITLHYITCAATRKVVCGSRWPIFRLFSSGASYVEIIRSKEWGNRSRIRTEIEGSSLSLSSAGEVYLVWQTVFDCGICSRSTALTDQILECCEFWQSAFDCRYRCTRPWLRLSLAFRGSVVVELRGTFSILISFRSMYLVVLRDVLLGSPESLKLR